MRLDTTKEYLLSFPSFGSQKRAWHVHEINRIDILLFGHIGICTAFHSIHSLSLHADSVHRGK